MPGQRLWPCKLPCPGMLAVISDHFGTLIDVISGQYPVPCPLTLNVTLKVKCQDKAHGCIRSPGRIAII